MRRYRRTTNIKARFDLKTSTIDAKVVSTLPPEEAGQSTAFVLSDKIELRKVDGGRGAHITVEPTDQPFKGLRKITFTFDKAPTRPVVLKFDYAGTAGGDEGLRIDPSQGIELSLEDMWAPVRPNFGLMFTADADLSGIPADEVAVAQGQVSRHGKNASYVKGPMLLFESDTQVGRPRMDEFLAALGREPPRTTEQFLAILGRVAGPDVAREFEAKLRAP
jgi:hypothetical protein